MVTHRLHFGTLLLSAIIALALWGMAHGTSSIERSVDVPIVFHDVAPEVVITGHSVNAVNIRVVGSRAALANVTSLLLEYPLDLSSAQPGPAVFEVEESQIELPRGARILSRSPASIEVTLEGKGRKALKIRPDIEGEPAEGYVIGRVDVEPRRIWLAGAHSEVIRLNEVMTETIDVEGATASLEKEVRISLASDHVWPEEETSITVRVEVEEIPEPPAPEGEAPPAADAPA